MDDVGLEFQSAKFRNDGNPCRRNFRRDVPENRAVNGNRVALRRGLNPLTSPGKDHVSHRLLALGLKPRIAVAVLYTVGIASGLLAVVVYRRSFGEAVVLLEDEELRRRMGAAGRQRAETRFSSRMMIERTLELYRRLG